MASDAVSGQEGSDKESGDLSQQNRESTEFGEGATVDGIARDKKDFRVPVQEVRGVDLPDLFQKALLRLLALMAKGWESTLRKGCFCSWPCHLLLLLFFKDFIY